MNKTDLEFRQISKFSKTYFLTFRSSFLSGHCETGKMAIPTRMFSSWTVFRFFATRTRAGTVVDEFQFEFLRNFYSNPKKNKPNLRNSDNFLYFSQFHSTPNRSLHISNSKTSFLRWKSKKSTKVQFSAFDFGNSNLQILFKITSADCCALFGEQKI